ncbi:MAG TPA: pyruvate ferredoxin oxidoreductase [Candidatus Tenderia electrophaga]|uniref:Pyruvate ferredoxin oxidoreductase n=1 Tax=Candidatus Tenderia electrophaga TaxID=1748243 RepID=A0A832N422_9GAMM|nr:pyruvate ferredoxin oxidoreductase [Candidatus Tenderia electrophaga]
MHTFHEIRLHGRGGQGTVSAAALMALAAFEDGFESQAFPKFGSERRGAPVEAYVRISSSVIRSHNQVYSPDVIVVQDAGLLRSETLLGGLKQGGLIVLNGEPPSRDEEGGFRWLCLPASEIAKRHLGRPLPNTVLLGALLASTQWLSLNALEQAVTHHLSKKGDALVKANIDALREGYESIMQGEVVR